MSEFDKLDPLVQYHIVNTLGWNELRPLQEQSISPVLSGHHCLLLAPTAGGKTEAACFPILSQICSSNWQGLSVIYVCPLKALLNNLHLRLEGYCNMVGRRCGLWHGDIGPGQRKRMLSDPPDILLTTPESLEVMLISAKKEGRDMLRDVRLVVIDEIHAFAGDDRGWHLLALLERIGRHAGREIQRIGLSATVGNPEELLKWLAGHCDGQRTVIQPSENTSGAAKANVELDYVGSIENAAIVISRLHRGEKRLVFCDSRSRVEELGVELRRLGVSVFLSHSSLSAEERQISERSFAEASDCVIVATSTLELGIDVGNLDRVIQIDAPRTVASFLQRIGRTGRRKGLERNCLFLTTNDDALLRAAAIIQLWEEGYVEPVTPPPRPLHLFSQQLLALSLQEGGIGINDWAGWLLRLPAFGEESQEVITEILDHLQQEQVLFNDGIRLSCGTQGEQLYGRRHFLELVSIFTSDPMFKILYGRKELGSVDRISFAKHTEGQPTVLSMGAKTWMVTSIDWQRRQAFVVPTQQKGRSQWMSVGLGTSYTVCQAVQSCLLLDAPSPRWSSRFRAKLSEVHESFDHLDGNQQDVISDHESGRLKWVNFSGQMNNTALASALESFGYEKIQISDFNLVIDTTKSRSEFLDDLRKLDSEFIVKSWLPSDEFIDQLKFNETLPENLVTEMLSQRLVTAAEITSIMKAAEKIEKYD